MAHRCKSDFSTVYLPAQNKQVTSSVRRRVRPVAGAQAFIVRTSGIMSPVYRIDTRAFVSNRYI